MLVNLFRRQKKKKIGLLHEIMMKGKKKKEVFLTRKKNG